MKTKEILDVYYKGFAQKSGYESVLSENFKFIGGDMTKTTPIVGKQANIELFRRFSTLFTSMRVKEMYIDGDSACVRANYDYVFQKGDKVNGDVAEFWKIKDDKLESLTIFFDTLTFQQLTQK